MPRVTVALVTWRLGGLDLTRRGLDAQAYRDFELAIVDLLHPWRAAAVARLFAGARYPVRPLPDGAGADPLIQHE